MQSLTVEFPRSENALKTLRQLVLSSINFSKKSYAESLLPHQSGTCGCWTLTTRSDVSNLETK